MEILFCWCYLAHVLREDTDGEEERREEEAGADVEGGSVRKDAEVAVDRASDGFAVFSGQGGETALRCGGLGSQGGHSVLNTCERCAAGVAAVGLQVDAEELHATVGADNV